MEKHSTTFILYKTIVMNNISKRNIAMVFAMVFMLGMVFSIWCMFTFTNNTGVAASSMLFALCAMAAAFCVMVIDREGV